MLCVPGSTFPLKSVAQLHCVVPLFSRLFRRLLQTFKICFYRKINGYIFSSNFSSVFTLCLITVSYIFTLPVSHMEVCDSCSMCC